MLPVFHFPILYLFPFLRCICCYVFAHAIPEVLCLQSVSVAQRQVEHVWNLPLGWSERGQVEWHLPDASWKGLDVCLARGANDSWKTEVLYAKSGSRTGGIRMGRKCCYSLCFGNSNASLDFSRDFHMVVWFEELRPLSTFSPFLVAFLFILDGALCLRTTFFFLYGNFSNLWQIDEFSGTGEKQWYKKDHVILEFWSEGEVIEEHIPTLE